MATKGDLVEAQRYSRRRLRTAFTSGIPQGTELEPRNYMRSVIGGIAIAVLMVVGSLLFGYIKPGLPQGWENNRLLVGSSGARYVSVSGTLYPVTNLASARLMFPASEFKVVTVDEKKVASAPRGPLVGIVGAPDSLPSSKNLEGTDWVSCLNDDNTLAITLGDTSGVDRAKNDAAILVKVGDAQYLVAGGHRYGLPDNSAERIRVLRALGLDSASVTEVPARWVNLFTAGTAISEWDVGPIGEAVPNTSFVVGEVLTLRQGESSSYYVVGQGSRLIPVSEFTLRLYAISDQKRPQPREVSQQDIGGLQNAPNPALADDWPTAVPTALAASGQRCAVLTAGSDGMAAPALATAASGKETAQTGAHAMASGDTVTIAPSGGALVGVRGQDPKSAVKRAYLVDSLGTAYPVTPFSEGDAMARLGYKESDVSIVPSGWVKLFAAGPALTVTGALTEVGTSKTVGDTATASPTSTATSGPTDAVDTGPDDASTDDATPVG